MTRPLRLRTLFVAPLLALTFAMGVGAGLTPTPAFAQNEPAAEGEDKSGRPLDGYLLTGCLVGLAMFIVGKTARRQ